MAENTPRRPNGIPVDSTGGPTVDPTKNVLDLVDAANKRQDDLRGAIVQRVDAEIQGLRDDLRAEISHIIDLINAADKRYEQRFEAQKEAIAAALMSQDRAVSKAENAAERRFEGVNEFRAQLGDQQRTLMPRVEAENRLSAMGEKIGVLEGFRTEMLSKGTGAKEGYGMAIGVVGVFLSILSIISVGILLLTRLMGAQ